ncbi:MAG: DEAD/DEAH box helicase family protein [Nanoarchaeota archaeon]|nr:DEAD/DEAH box helicase family protein [Nanoarchaeota archaeon]
MQNKYLLNIIPRDYQENIFEKIKDKNSLVVLPTGIGKTLIALMLTIYRMEKYPLQKIVFLAPTRPLAEQHFEYFKKHLPDLFAQMDLFTGKIVSENRKKIWNHAEIIFSTPQCIANDLEKNMYNLSEVSLLIEDEVHRCVKNYAYTFVAKKYRAQAEFPQLLGLTASPGSDKKSIKTICENLAINHVEIRTRESPDVVPYIQELEIQTIKVPFPKKFDEIRILLKQIYQKNTDYLKIKNLIQGPANKITLLQCQTRLFNILKSNSKNPSLFLGISRCAQALKISHALDLLETQTLYSLNCYFEKLQEQARQDQSKAVKNIIASAEFTQSLNLLNELLSKKLEHPKLLELKSIIKDKISENKKARIIVFAQFRDSVNCISKELNKIKNVKSEVFIGQAKKAGSGLSQKEQMQIIRNFSSGKFNILIATSIGEEGLDIPEVNAVIFYEPVPSAIRKIQRAGRTARLMSGELIMLITKDTKDEGTYWSAHHKEKKMHNAIKDINQDLKSGKLNFNNKQKELL